MTQFVVSHKPENIEVKSNKNDQPIRLVVGPPDFNPYVVQGALWRGVLRISIRQHFRPKANPEILLPSKNGIDLVPAAAFALAHAILQIEQELRGGSTDAVAEDAVQSLGATAAEIEEPKKEIPI